MEGGEGPSQGNPGQQIEGERKRTPAEQAGDLLIDGIIKYPATDYEAGAYLALKIRERELIATDLSAAFLSDEKQISRVTQSANVSHERARSENPKIPPETITDYDIKVVGKTLFEIAHELDELTTEEITEVLNYKPEGDSKFDKPTVDDMRRMYTDVLKKKHREQKEQE